MPNPCAWSSSFAPSMTESPIPIRPALIVPEAGPAARQTTDASARTTTAMTRARIASGYRGGRPRVAGPPQAGSGRAAASGRRVRDRHVGGTEVGRLTARAAPLELQIGNVDGGRLVGLDPLERERLPAARGRDESRHAGLAVARLTADVGAHHAGLGGC